jgi:hypothetical protein
LASLNKFKNSNGQLYTKRLFFETTTLINDRDSAIYTLKDEDHVSDGKTYLSLYKRYLDLEDVTEFTFANQFFDSYEHFRILTQAEWFLDHVKRWRRELQLKLKNRLYDALKARASDPTDKNSFESVKLLINLLDPPQRSSRGRPKKDEIAMAVKEIAKEEQSLADDHKRVFAQ